MYFNELNHMPVDPSLYVSIQCHVDCISDQFYPYWLKLRTHTVSLLKLQTLESMSRAAQENQYWSKKVPLILNNDDVGIPTR